MGRDTRIITCKTLFDYFSKDTSKLRSTSPSTQKMIKDFHTMHYDYTCDQNHVKCLLLKKHLFLAQHFGNSSFDVEIR